MTTVVYAVSLRTRQSHKEKESVWITENCSRTFTSSPDATANDVRALEAISEPTVCTAERRSHTWGRSRCAVPHRDGDNRHYADGERDGLRHHGEWAGFGELSFFERGPRPAAAYAHEPTHLLRISYERLAQVLTERPELALLVYRNACAFFAKHMRRLALTLNNRYL